MGNGRPVWDFSWIGLDQKRIISQTLVVSNLHITVAEERNVVLDAIKEDIQKRGYLPVIFDLEGPSSGDVTETIMVLASLAKLVVADISSPKSIPQELTSIIPHFPSLPVQPVIEQSQREYGVFDHFKHYPWVFDQIEYSENDIKSLVEKTTKNCERHAVNKT